MKLNLTQYFGSTGGVVVFILIALALGIGVPWFVITGLNALFPALAIPFTLETWSAVWILNAFARFTITTSK